MNTVVDFPYNFRLRVKFTIHMMNSTGAKIGLNCTKYFRSIVLLVLAHTIALNKFRLYSFRKQTINLVLMIKYNFSFRLQFNTYKKCVFQALPKSCLITSAELHLTFCRVIKCCCLCWTVDFVF